MSKYLIIDSNLFLLLVIGSVENGELIRKSDRLSKYTYDDFKLVKMIMKHYAINGYGISQYIAAEVSNLIDIKIDPDKKNAFIEAKIIFSTFIQIDSNIKEDSDIQYFTEYGITDSFMCNAINKHFILTNDSRLCSILTRINYKNLIDYKAIKQSLKGSLKLKDLLN